MNDAAAAAHEAQASRKRPASHRDKSRHGRIRVCMRPPPVRRRARSSAAWAAQERPPAPQPPPSTSDAATGLRARLRSVTKLPEVAPGGVHGRENGHVGGGSKYDRLSPAQTPAQDGQTAATCDHRNISACAQMARRELTQARRGAHKSIPSDSGPSPAASQTEAGDERRGEAACYCPPQATRRPGPLEAGDTETPPARAEEWRRLQLASKRDYPEHSWALKCWRHSGPAEETDARLPRTQDAAHSSSSMPGPDGASLRPFGPAIGSTNDPPATSRLSPIDLVWETLHCSSAGANTETGHQSAWRLGRLKQRGRGNIPAPQAAARPIFCLLTHLVIVLLGLLARRPQDAPLASSVLLASCERPSNRPAVANSPTNMHFGLDATTPANITTARQLARLVGTNNSTSFYQDQLKQQAREAVTEEREGQEEATDVEQEHCDSEAAAADASASSSGSGGGNGDAQDDYSDYGTYIIFEASAGTSPPAGLHSVLPPPNDTGGLPGAADSPSETNASGRQDHPLGDAEPQLPAPLSIQRVFFAAKARELAHPRELTAQAPESPVSAFREPAPPSTDDKSTLTRRQGNWPPAGKDREHQTTTDVRTPGPADYTNSLPHDGRPVSTQQHEAGRDDTGEPLNHIDVIRSLEPAAHGRRGPASGRAVKGPPEPGPRQPGPRFPARNIITTSQGRATKAPPGIIDMQYSSTGPVAALSSLSRHHRHAGPPAGRHGAPEKNINYNNGSSSHADNKRHHHHPAGRRQSSAGLAASSLNGSSSSSLTSNSFNIAAHGSAEQPAPPDNNAAQRQQSARDLMEREPAQSGKLVATSPDQPGELAAPAPALAPETKTETLRERRHESHNGAPSSPATGRHRPRPGARSTNSIQGVASVEAGRRRTSSPSELQARPAPQPTAAPYAPGGHRTRDPAGQLSPLSALPLKVSRSGPGPGRGDDDDGPPRAARSSRGASRRRADRLDDEGDYDQQRPQLYDEDVKWLSKMNEISEKAARAASRVQAGPREPGGPASQLSRSAPTESGLSSTSLSGADAPPVPWRKQSARPAAARVGPRDKAPADKSGRNKFDGPAAFESSSSSAQDEHLEGNAAAAAAAATHESEDGAMSLLSGRGDANGVTLNSVAGEGRAHGAEGAPADGGVLAWLRAQFMAAIGLGQSEGRAAEAKQDDELATFSGRQNASTSTSVKLVQLPEGVQVGGELAGANQGQEAASSGDSSGGPWNPRSVNVTPDGPPEGSHKAGQPAGHNVYYWRLVWFVLPLGATFGNLLVILAVYRERSLQSVTNYFIVSLAFADLCVGLVVMPFAVYVLVNEIWDLSDLLCDIFVAVDVTSSTASILNLVAISIDRYLAIAHPIAYSAGSSSTRAISTICLVWLISCCVGAPIILGLNTTAERQSSLCILYNSTFIFWSSLTSFYVPCIIMIGLYWRIFSAIRSRTKKVLIHHQVGGTAKANELAAGSGATTNNDNNGQQGQQVVSSAGGGRVQSTNSWHQRPNAAGEQRLQLRRNSKTRRQMQTFGESKSAGAELASGGPARSAQPTAGEPTDSPQTPRGTSAASQTGGAELKCEAIVREGGRRLESPTLSQLVEQEHKQQLLRRARPSRQDRHHQCCPLHDRRLRSVADSDCRGLDEDEDDESSYPVDSLCYNSRSEDDSSESSGSSNSSSNYDCSLANQNLDHQHHKPNSQRLLSSAGNSPRAAQRTSCCPGQQPSGSLVLTSSKPNSSSSPNTIADSCPACERCFALAKKPTSEQATPTRCANHQLAIHNEISLTNADSTSSCPNRKRSSVLSSTNCCESHPTSTRCGHSVTTSASYDCTSGVIMGCVGAATGLNGETTKLLKCAQCALVNGPRDSPAHSTGQDCERSKNVEDLDQPEPVGMLQSARQTIKRRSMKLAQILRGRSRDSSTQADPAKKSHDGKGHQQVYNISGEPALATARNQLETMTPDEPTQSSSSGPAGRSTSSSDSREHQKDGPVLLAVIERPSTEQDDEGMTKVVNELDDCNANDNHQRRLSGRTRDVGAGHQRQQSLNPLTSDLTICEKSTTVTSSSDKLLSAVVSTAAVAMATSNLNQTDGHRSQLTARQNQLVSSMMNLMNKRHGRRGQAAGAHSVHDKSHVVPLGSEQQKQVVPPIDNKQLVQQHHHHRGNSRRRREKNAARRERKATKTLAIVLGIFLICWTPFFTCNIIDGICIQLSMDCRPGMSVYLVTSWLGYINSCVNPIIYTIFNMEFRRAFKKILTTMPDCSGCIN